MRISGCPTLSEIRRAFEKNRVEIPVMGCYMDLGKSRPQCKGVCG